MSDSSATEMRLIELARDGDRRAQQVVWRTHRRWVAAIVLAHRPRSEEVDDLMQDVAVKFVSKVQTLRDPEAFRPWLRQIVINVCRGAARSLRPTLHLEESPRDDGGSDSNRVPVPGNDQVADLVEDEDEARRLLHQLMTLPTDYREPLLLRCVRSLSYQQISELMELPVTTIETRLARARRMLRDELAANDHDHDSPSRLGAGLGPA